MMAGQLLLVNPRPRRRESAAERAKLSRAAKRRPRNALGEFVSGARRNPKRGVGKYKESSATRSRLSRDALSEPRGSHGQFVKRNPRRRAMATRRREPVGMLDGIWDNTLRPAAVGTAGAMVIGAGGTFTNLGRMAAARRGISLDEPVHGLSVSTAEVEHLLDKLAAMTLDERTKVPGLNPSRADIIVAGLAVTGELLKRAKSRGVIVSAFGLREGLLLEMAGAETVAASDNPMRLVREFAERCHVDRGHGEQVRALALTLFDALAEPLGAAPDERALLEAAAILHDVGQLVNYKNHQKHSFQLIVHADRLDFKAEERLLVAHIARYHRKGGPSKRHADFAVLKPEDQLIVRRMSALLRLADGLDRGGSATVGDVEVSLSPGEVRIGVSPREAGTDLSLECWAAGRKSDVLHKLLARDVNIVQLS